MALATGMGTVFASTTLEVEFDHPGDGVHHHENPEQQGNGYERWQKGSHNGFHSWELLTRSSLQWWRRLASSQIGPLLASPD